MTREEDWLRQCYWEATLSPDPSTQLGAVIVIGSQIQQETLSHNGPTAGWTMTDYEWNHKPTKYQLVEHAERRAIYKAAKKGLWLEGATLVASWAACADCARAIVESGIKTLIRHYPPLDDATERWLQSVSIGNDIMKANDVKIIDVIGNIPDAPLILRGSEFFDPSGGESDEETDDSGIDDGAEG
jgi:dCMP deaminase